MPNDTLVCEKPNFTNSQTKLRLLNPEAREALRAEFMRRHLSVKKVNWRAESHRPDTRKPRPHIVGDAAGEANEMVRGRYYAWLHVGISFALEIILIAALLYEAMQTLLRVDSSNAVAIGISVGTALAFLIYSDRWHCIEAFSSRYCSGVANLSLFSVPVIALLYANYRGFKKLQRR